MPALASGMFAKAEIVPSQKVTAWSIPYDALLDGDAGMGDVFITNDGKTAKKYRCQSEQYKKIMCR